ncbi:MAG: tetratricopeptide repeat protein [Candidatus Aminicenantaceae bacterium]
MNLKRMLVLSALFTFLFASFGLQNSSDHKVLFEKAKYTMETKGDLNAAIKLFEEIVQKYPNERVYAAKSQLYIGFCYEKLGLQQAQAAFQKVVENYPDQTEAVVVAREKLITLTRLHTLTYKGDGRFQIRRICEVSSGWKGGSISPLGGFFAFADRMNSYGDVAVYDLSSGKIRRLTNDATETEGAYECVISSDGKRIAYGWLNNSDGSEGLRVIKMDGSKPSILYRDTNGIPMAPADWSTEGKEILVYHNGIAMVSANDGSIRILKKGNPKYKFLNGRMRISPDGRYIAYDWPPEGDSSNRSIFILAADGSYDAPLIDKSSNDFLLDWCPDGKSLLFRSDRTGSWDAWRIRVKDGRVDGTAELVKKDLGSIDPLGFTRNGSFYFMSSLGGMDIYTARIDMSTGKIIEGPEKSVERGVGKNVSASWSPDGKNLAYIAAGSIHIRSENTGEEKEISPQPGFYGIEWFPDGSSLKVYGEDKDGNRGLFRVDAKTGAVETLLMQTSEAPLHRVCLGPDGKNFYYSSYRDLENLSFIFAYEIKSRQKKEIWRGEGKVGHPLPSPDGQWLAMEIYQNGGSGSRLAVMPATGGEIRELAESSSLGEYVWTPDSKQLLFAKFVAGSGWGTSRQELWVVSASGGAPKSLNLESRMMWLLTMHPDGDRIAYTSGSGTSKAEIWVMENFLSKEKSQKK